MTDETKTRLLITITIVFTAVAVSILSLSIRRADARIAEIERSSRMYAAIEPTCDFFNESTGRLLFMPEPTYYDYGSIDNNKQRL